MRHDDVEMIIVYQSPPKNVRKWMNENRPSVRVISDPDMDLYRRYRVEESLLAAIRPEPL
ncbi:MAG: redoxin domain-containing protein [Deltaproteobacteria bacterium]|nr:redoxin domain-containing protein [Deltaproteobacteria bacterium]